MQFWMKIALPVLLVVVASINLTSACSCMPAHPQTHACSADFVIMARVKKVIFLDEHTHVYKVRIKKEFKMTEKARVVLKSGRLLTSAQSSMCGINLNVEETYLITGRVYAGKARISLCGFHQPWNQLTIRQKKGFRLLYRQGCNCEIVDCPWWRQCPKESSPSDICAWETSSYSDSSSLHDCQQKHAVCMKTVSGGCGWSVDKKYRECMKTRRLMRKEKLDNEP